MHAVLTDGMSKVLRHVSYELEDEEEEAPKAPADGEKKKASSSSSSKESSKRTEEEDGSQKKKKSGGAQASASSSAKSREGSAKPSSRDKEKEKEKKSAPGGGVAISAAVLNNAESVILRDRYADREHRERADPGGWQRGQRKKSLHGVVYRDLSILSISTLRSSPASGIYLSLCIALLDQTRMPPEVFCPVSLVVSPCQCPVRAWGRREACALFHVLFAFV